MKRSTFVVLISIVLTNFALVNASAGQSCVSNKNRNTGSLNSLSCTNLGTPGNGFNNGPREVFVNPKPRYGDNGYTRGKTRDGRTVMCKEYIGRMVCK
jgi:hypothetical protein